MKNIRITEQTLPEITMAIQVALDAKKEYQICITAYDKSLHARQRALCNIWYGNISKEIGEPIGHVEAYCKYHFGLKLRCKQDIESAKEFSGEDVPLECIIRSMLDNKTYEDKLSVICNYPEWFPILRAKGGLNVEYQAEYLRDIQRHFAEQGVILTSPREDDLLRCKEAQK